jgi:hypothetical protein
VPDIVTLDDPVAKLFELNRLLATPISTENSTEMHPSDNPALTTTLREETFPWTTRLLIDVSENQAVASQKLPPILFWKE